MRIGGFSFFCGGWGRWFRLGMLLAGACGLALGGETGPRNFDVPPGWAETTLRRFAEQAGVQFVFSATKVAGVRTQLVRGRVIPRAALEQMLDGTELRAVYDEQSGALTVDRIVRARPEPRPRTPAPPPPAELVQLSAFEVRSSREYGYRAPSSVTATGIGTAIADIPVNVGVVTSEFMQDWGGVELRDATKGVSGINSDSQNSNRVWLRGFESSRILQDGFEIGYGMMTDGVDRIEVIKGPSAIFHGEVNPAGVVNLISARPTWVPQSQVRIALGSERHARSAVQVSGPLLDRRLAYLAFGSYTDEKGWADHLMRRIRVVGGALTWQPLPAVKLTVDGRWTDKTRIEPALLPFSHPAFVAAVQAGEVAPLTTARAWLNAHPLYGPNEPQSQVLVEDLVFRSRESNPFNGNYPQTESRATAQAELTYQPRQDVGFRIGAFRNTGERVNGFFTSFRPVAGFHRDLVFAASEHRFNYTRNEQQRSGFKADLNLNLTLGNVRHAWLFGFERYHRRIGGVTIGTTPRLYVPLVEPERDALAELRAANPRWFPAIPDFGRLRSNGTYVADQISLVDGKVRFLTGVRQMDLKVYTPGTTRGQGRTNDQSRITPQAGVLVRPTPWGGFYFNYSETFESQLVVDVLGGVSGPITGAGMEAGYKADWPDGRLSATLGVYRIERANIARRDTPRERELNIFPLWSLGGVQRTEGLDLDVTARPGRNVQLVLTYAHMWLAKTLADPQTPQQVGVRLRHAPEHAVGLWGKYTFPRGALKGWYVGAGASYRSTFHFHDSWDVSATSSNHRVLDLLLGYKRLLKDRGEMAVGLNVNNVTNTRYFDFQYMWADPVNWRLTLDFRY